MAEELAAYKVFPMEIKAIKNYIGGEFLDSISNKRLDNFCPATGEVYSTLPDSTDGDVNHAVETAKAFKSWKNTSKKKGLRFFIELQI